jgi:selenocysteine-specific elongation factor
VLPKPDRQAPVRLWVDRSFTVKGSGTVVTGTLTAGTLSSHDRLVLASSGREVHVRGLQSLGRPVERVGSVARVAVNLRGVEKADVGRGDALLTPNAWRTTSAVDVLLHGSPAEEVARELMVHVGSAAVPGRVRPLGSDIARLALSAPLALRVGDLLLLRDPGRHRIVASARVLDAQPSPLRRRGAAAARARELHAMSDDGDAELRRRGIARGAELRAAGVRTLPTPFSGDWLVDAGHAASLRDRLAQLVAQHVQRFPLEPGPSVDAVRRVLDLPDRSLVAALVESATGSGLTVRDGRVVDTRRDSTLPAAVAASVAKIRARLVADPFDAPEAGELAALALGPRELAAAERAGELLRIADGVVLLPDAAGLAVARLAAVPQPFTVSEARQALGTTRRVAVPLLELLDRRRMTRRHADGSRTIV